MYFLQNKLRLYHHCQSISTETFTSLRSLRTDDQGQNLKSRTANLGSQDPRLPRYNQRQVFPREMHHVKYTKNQ